MFRERGGGDAFGERRFRRERGVQKLLRGGGLPFFDERDGEVIRGRGVDLAVGDRLLQSLNRGVGFAGAVKRPTERREIIAVVRLLLNVARRVLNGAFSLFGVVLFAEREREPGDRLGVERILTDGFLERRLGLRIIGAEERDFAVNL